MGKEGGYDWGNLLSVYYEPILDPQDPRVTATLKATRRANMPKAHHDRVARRVIAPLPDHQEHTDGDDSRRSGASRKEFYALLAHTSSTNAGFEYKIRPWGDRNFGDNLSPHGWFAAEYRTLLRSMLVREEGDQLHLLSVVSPAWIGPGKTIAASQRQLTGSVAFRLTSLANEAIWPTPT